MGSQRLSPLGNETAQQFVDRVLARRPKWLQCLNQGVSTTIFDLSGTGYFRHLSIDYKKLIDEGGVFYWFEGLSFAYTEHYYSGWRDKKVMISDNATPEFTAKIERAKFYSTLTRDQMIAHCGSGHASF